MCRTYFDGYDEEETVKIVFAGNQQPKSVELTNAAMDCDADELSRRIEEAMLDAHAKCALLFFACLLACYWALGPGRQRLGSKVF